MVYSTLELIRSDWNRNPHKKFNKLYTILNKRFSYRVSDIFLFFIALTGFCQSFTFQFWWRLNRKKGFFKFITKTIFTHYYRKWGLHIPSVTNIGPGLILLHPLSLVINPKVRIGKNCEIFQFVSIGESKGKAAIIGDNVSIGPNVCIVGGVKIGSNVKIGAGTVVINDIPDNCTSVGNPNRVIKHGN